MAASKNRRLAAVLFADIVGYTALMQKDEATAYIIIKRFQNTLETKVADYNGQLINFYGDGALCTFQSPVEAIRCAMDIQVTFRSAPKIPLRIGIHSGTVIFEGGKIYGDTVNLTSRIESLGVPGAILFSKKIRNEIKNQAELQLRSLGNFDLKNVEDKMEIFALANEGFVIPDKNEIIGKLKTKTTNFKLVYWGLVAFVLMSLGVWFFQFNPENSTALTLSEDIAAIPNVTATTTNSIAILPFDNFSTETDNQYFADGMHDDLLTYLSKSEGIKVISRTSVTALEKEENNIQEIAQLLGVTHVLEGSIRKAGNTIRLNVQLIKAASDEHLWAEIYDIELSPKNIFDTQTKIAQAISKELTQSLSQLKPIPPPTLHTNNLQAYENYLRARQLKEAGNTESLYQAKKLLEEAIQLDDQFALAHIILGNLYIHLVYYAGEDPETNYNKSWELMEKGRALNENLAEAYMLKGSLNHWWKRDLEEASKAYEQAIRLNPNYDKAYYGYAIAVQDLARDFKKVSELFGKALLINPLNPQLINSNGIYQRENGQIEEAIETFKKGIKVAPNHPLLWSNYAGTYYYTSRLDSVTIISHRSVAQNGNEYLFLRYYLEALNDLSLFSELEKELKRFELKTKQDSLLYMHFQRELYMHQKDFQAVEVLNEQLRGNDLAWPATNLDHFEMAYYQRDFKKAVALFEKKYPAETIDAAITAFDLKGLTNFRAYIHALYRLNLKDKADALLSKYETIALVKPDGKGERIFETNYRKYLKAFLLQMNGQTQESMELIDDYFQAGNFHQLKWMEIDPIFDDVRNDPNYLNFLDKYKRIIEEQQENFRQAIRIYSYEDL